jgi:CelD/BcsL family acetyltransferase involved in cellulose biosynthesis
MGAAVLKLLSHPLAFLRTPLVDRDWGAAAIDAWLAWCRNEIGTAVAVCTGIPSDGAVGCLLRQRLAARGAQVSEFNLYHRPLLALTGDGDGYIRAALSGDRRRKLLRQRRQLESGGGLVLRALKAGEDIEEWVGAFIRLEASGWKGERGSAIGSKPAYREVFCDTIQSLHRLNQVHFIGFQRDRQWIAMNCFLRAVHPTLGAFGFKSAYDELFSKLSPSNLLLLELVGFLNERAVDIGWLDSCARSENQFLGALFRERRAISTLAIGLPGLKGRVAMGGLRLGLRARDALRPEAAAGRASQSAGLVGGR